MFVYVITTALLYGVPQQNRTSSIYASVTRSATGSRLAVGCSEARHTVTASTFQARS